MNKPHGAFYIVPELMQYRLGHMERRRGADIIVELPALGAVLVPRSRISITSVVVRSYHPSAAAMSTVRADGVLRMKWGNLQQAKDRPSVFIMRSMTRREPR